MQLVVVIQWARALGLQSHLPNASLASRSGANATCQPSHGRTKLEGARRQAA